MSFLNRRAAAGAAALALALAACDAGDPVSPAGGAQGQTQPLLAGVTNATRPSGTVDIRTNIQLNPTLADALGRMSGKARGRYNTAHGGIWIFSTDIWRTGQPMSPTSRTDPRFPLLQEVDGPEGGELFLFGSEAAGGYWEMWSQSDLAGLKPNTVHEVAFVHYRLGVNGTVDHVRRILNGDGVNPDTLKITAGSVARINSDWTGAAPAGCAPYPGVNANPFVIATTTTDGDGVLTFDKCWLPTNGLGGAAPLATSMVGLSNNQPYNLPNYNYIVVYEGTVEEGKPVRRMQIAQDLNAAGQPVPNAFAPFPAANTKLKNRYTPAGTYAGQEGAPATDTLPTLPLNFSAQLALPAAFGEPDSIIVRMQNVQRLENGTYKAWYVNRTTNEAKPAIGRYLRRSITVNPSDTALRDTTIFENVAGTSTFKGGPEQIIFVTRPYGEIGNPNVSDSLTTFLITIEQNEDAATPSSFQPFWVEGIIKNAGTALPTTLNFGDANFNQGTAAPRTFTAQGTFSGGVIGDTVIIGQGEDTEVVFEGSTVRLNFSGLTRPPEGYEYVAYMCKDTCSPLLPASSFLAMGTLTGPGDEDLTQADDPDYSSSNVVGSRINSAFLTFDFESSGATVCEFDRFRLALQPKGAVDIPTTYVIDAPLAATITGADSCR